MPIMCQALFWVPSTVDNPPNMLLLGGFYYYAHFTDEIEAQSH